MRTSTGCRTCLAAHLCLTAHLYLFVHAATAAAQPSKDKHIIRVGTSSLARASTIAGGLALIPPGQKKRFTVEIEAGIYRERVWVNASMGPVTLTGLGLAPDDVLLVFQR